MWCWGIIRDLRAIPCFYAKNMLRNFIFWKMGSHALAPFSEAKRRYAHARPRLAIGWGRDEPQKVSARGRGIADIKKETGRRIGQAVIKVQKCGISTGKKEQEMVFQAAALIILLAFYGCYFAKMIFQKKMGIRTDQMGKGKTGFVKGVEVTLKIVTILVPLVELAGIGWKLSLLPVWARVLGVVFGVLGVTVFVCAVITMQDNWRAGVPETDSTELVTRGIFQISRNPAFLGFDLVYIGILLMFFNWVLFAVSVLAMFLLHLQIVNVEEDFLITAFGESYLEYRKKVCRYFGRKIDRKK